MIKHLVISFVFSFIYLFSYGQDLSGYWKGTLSMRGCFPENYIELQVNIKGTTVTGFSYHYLDANNYIRKELTGTYHPAAKTLSLQEGIVTTYQIPSHCVICIKKYELRYRREGNVETLSGDWTGYVQNTSSNCAPGTLTLSRIKESFFQNVPPPAPVIPKKEPEVPKEVEKEIPQIHVDTGEIRLDFYDNGEIDGDTITVLVNKKVVVSQQRLTAKPITVFVKIDENTIYQEVEMIAENLGSIPPNTALLIITAGTKRHKLFLTSTETKSARVKFVYDKDIKAKDVTTDAFK